MKKVWIWAIGIFTVVAIAGTATGISLWLINRNKKDFGDDFKFGASTSSYQIEGGWNEGNKTASIWDTAVHNASERMRNNENGDVAADSYHLYKEDVKALKATGVNFYRFSISWTRILPDGAKTNQAGVDYYNNLIDELIANDIEPMVTIYHWDLPQYIQDLGGWTNEFIVDYFDHYSDVLFEKFGDRVKSWITFNEPFNFCNDGYGSGSHPPFIPSVGVGNYLCAHNVLLSHAKAYHNYKNNYKATQKGEVGISLYTQFYYPTDSEHAELADNVINHVVGLYAHPIFSKDGNYPQVMIDSIKKNSENEHRLWSRLPQFTAAQIESLKGAADFFGVNYFTSRNVKPKVTFPDEFGWDSDAGFDAVVDSNWPKSPSGFIYSVPQGLRDMLVWIKNEYNNPKVVITENGYPDEGTLEDDDRITFIRDHLYAVKDAINDGCDVRAYAAWSLIDNFEWLFGYSEKFGIYYVNFTSATKERIAKKSSVYLNELINTKKI